MLERCDVLDDTIHVLRSTIRIDWYASWPFTIRSWPWPLVKLSKLHFKVKWLLIRRVSTRRTRCCQNECHALTESKVITETRFVKTAIFSFCSLEAKPLIVGQIWGHTSEISSKELSNALFRCAVAVIILELCAKGKIWLKVTSGDLTFDLTYNAAGS